VRIRQIKPSFWADENVAALTSDSVRLFYVGLWQLADDEGYLRGSVREIGAELYRFAPPAGREARVTRYLAELVTSGRIVQKACGAHYVVPHLTDHQHLGGLTKRVRTVAEAHRKACPVEPLPAFSRGDPRTSAGVGEDSSRGSVRKGSVRNVTREGGGTVTDFRRRVPIDEALG